MGISHSLSDLVVSLQRRHSSLFTRPMIAHLLGLPDTPGVMFLVFAGFGLLYFFLLASVAYFIYFKKFRARSHSSYELDPKEMKSAIN